MPRDQVRHEAQFSQNVAVLLDGILRLSNHLSQTPFGLSVALNSPEGCIETEQDDRSSVTTPVRKNYE
jgi:hypothetical protein